MLLLFLSFIFFRFLVIISFGKIIIIIIFSSSSNSGNSGGDDVEIVIVDIKGDQVKIGIKAPKSVSVHRAEVYEEIQLENKKAASAPKQLSGLGNLFSQFKKK